MCLQSFCWPEEACRVVQMEDNGIDLPRPGRAPVRGERPPHAPGFPGGDAVALHGLGLVPMDMSEDEASEGEDSDEDGLDADEVRSPHGAGSQDKSGTACHAQYKGLCQEPGHCVVSLLPMNAGVDKANAERCRIGDGLSAGEVRLASIFASP